MQVNGREASAASPFDSVASVPLWVELKSCAEQQYDKVESERLKLAEIVLAHSS